MLRKIGGPPTLERKICFFRAFVGTDEKGALLPFDPIPSLAAINALPFDDNGGRYLLDNEGNALCAWIDNMSGTPRMRFSQIRRTGLPQIDAAGRLSDLNLKATEGLVEAVHVVFFPDNVVGVEFNFYGPRPSRLGYYLGSTSKLGIFPALDPLLRSDVVSQLDRLKDVRLFDLKVHSSYAGVVKRADTDLGAAFESAGNLGSTDEIQVVLRPSKNGAANMLQRVKRVARTLLHRPDLRTEASHFVIRGKMEDSGRVEPLDLLRDQLIAHKKIIRVSERSRALDRTAAYEAVSQAYSERADELKAAAALIV